MVTISRKYIIYLGNKDFDEKTITEYYLEKIPWKFFTLLFDTESPNSKEWTYIISLMLDHMGCIFASIAPTLQHISISIHYCWLGRFVQIHLNRVCFVCLYLLPIYTFVIRRYNFIAELSSIVGYIFIISLLLYSNLMIRTYDTTYTYSTNRLQMEKSKSRIVRTAYKVHIRIQEMQEI